MKDVTKEDFKLYFYLYLMTLPFTWLIVEIVHIRREAPVIFLNVFIALSIWLYIKVIRPILNKEDDLKTNIPLFLLIIGSFLILVSAVIEIIK